MVWREEGSYPKRESRPLVGSGNTNQALVGPIRRALFTPECIWAILGTKNPKAFSALGSGLVLQF
jgi:hypothetical protein